MIRKGDHDVLSSTRRPRRGAGSGMPCPRAWPHWPWCSRPAAAAATPAGRRPVRRARMPSRRRAASPRVSFWHAMDGKNAEELTKLVSEFNADEHGQDRDQGDLRRQVRRRDHQVQGRDPEQVDARRHPGLRHRHPLHDRRQADRADAVVHRPRQARRLGPAAQHHRLLLGRRQAELHALQHVDAGHVLQQDPLQEGRPRPGEAPGDDRGDPRRRREAVEEERRSGRLRVRRGDLRLAARAVHRHQRRGVLRQGQRPRRQGDQGAVRPGRGHRGRVLVAEDGQGRPGRQHRARHQGRSGRVQVRPGRRQRSSPPVSSAASAPRSRTPAGSSGLPTTPR